MTFLRNNLFYCLRNYQLKFNKELISFWFWFLLFCSTVTIKKINFKLFCSLIINPQNKKRN